MIEVGPASPLVPLILFWLRLIRFGLGLRHFP
jgi:hypothetical protein